MKNKTLADEQDCHDGDLDVDSEDSELACIVGQETFWTAKYGEVEVDFVSFSSEASSAAGLIVVYRQVPHGFAATGYHTELLGAYPVTLPIYLH